MFVMLSSHYMTFHAVRLLHCSHVQDPIFVNNVSLAHCPCEQNIWLCLFHSELFSEQPWQICFDSEICTFVSCLLYCESFSEIRFKNWKILLCLQYPHYFLCYLFYCMKRNNCCLLFLVLFSYIYEMPPGQDQTALQATYAPGARCSPPLI